MNMICTKTWISIVAYKPSEVSMLIKSGTTINPKNWKSNSRERTTLVLSNNYCTAVSRDKRSKTNWC